MQLYYYGVATDSASAVDSTIQVSPPSVHLHIRFIEMPRAETGRLVQTFFHFRGIAVNPAINRDVVDIHATFSQHFLQFTIADTVFAVPTYRPQTE